MTAWQKFSHDLTIFFADLTSLCDWQVLHDSLVGHWHDLRQDNSRQTPLLLAVGIHLGVLIFSLAVPFVMSFKSQRIPEVYSVRLYTVQEAAPPPPTSKKVVQITTPVRKKVIAPKPVLRDVVSLSPIRQRLVKERKEKDAAKRRQDLQRQQLEQFKLDLRKDQAEQDALQAEQDLAEVQREAVSRIADQYRTADSAAKASNQPVVDSARTGLGTGEIDHQKLEALDRYRARITDHIAPHWQLPELQEWDATLRAVIVMQVNRDGTVTNSYFEKRSKDLRFNQYVEKAIDNAQPLPPFPIDFHEKTEEIGVTFSPGGLL